ncbi:MAG: hypothetical protein AB8B84_11780 [Granulosicoccus sp.]
MTDVEISLLIPGYLCPVRREGHTFSKGDTSSPVAMQWAKEGKQIPWQASLFGRITQSDITAAQLPVAELLQPNLVGNRGIVRADPVHLQADRDTAKLLPAQMLALDEGESEALIASLNEFLAADGFSVFPGPDQGWYMTGMDASTLESYPPSFLADRNASAFLPSGNNSESWRRLMTEIQMLLHTHPVNEQRTQHGKLPVNSLWFWGGANLTTYPSQAVGLNVYADDDFSKSLCSYLGVPCHDLAEFDPVSSGDAVIVDTRIASAHFARSESALTAATQRVDVEWLAVLSNRIRRRQIGSVTTINEDGDSGALTLATQRAYDRTQSVWGRRWAQMRRWFYRE